MTIIMERLHCYPLFRPWSDETTFVCDGATADSLWLSPFHVEMSRIVAASVLKDNVKIQFTYFITIDLA